MLSRISHLPSWLSCPILILRKYAETVAAQTCDRVIHLHSLLTQRNHLLPQLLTSSCIMHRTLHSIELGALVAKRKNHAYQMHCLKAGTSAGPSTLLVDWPDTFYRDGLGPIKMDLMQLHTSRRLWRRFRKGWKLESCSIPSCVSPGPEKSAMSAMMTLVVDILIFTPFPRLYARCLAYKHNPACQMTSTTRVVLRASTVVPFPSSSSPQLQLPCA